MTKRLEEWNNNTPETRFSMEGISWRYAMLSAAAEGKAFVGFDNKTTMLSDKSIEENDKYVQTKINRQDKLFDPNW